MQWKIDGPRTVPQAFPYQGSKRALVGQILSLFPDQGVPLLVEPFAGSAAISVAARLYGRAADVNISDVNAPLVDLWQMIIDSPDALLDSYISMWHEQQEGEEPLVSAKAYFLAKRREFNETKDPAILLYLLARCVKAAVRYGKNGDFNQSADNRRLGARPANMRERILGASRLMQGAKTTVESYEDPLVNAPREALVYMDPPYQGTTDVPDHRYLNGLAYNAFSDTLQRAVDNNVSFIVSYDVVREDKKYGEALPEALGLTHRHVTVGVSSQATLSGRKEMTVESLYISPALVARLGGEDQIDRLVDVVPEDQPALF
ncbi:DNA adenine methylase [Rhodococcus qingshengii]|uniref:DNA adenine methylase n=1 Tax=Rhodococcus qingshengii TaxID=334542 RepID=UPI0029425EBA|nr:DNA adenine methylase [Rhodococcus qingshengii]WOI85981.1 DNA adenine methylase [Rhodococcus qingshengii]